MMKTGSGFSLVEMAVVLIIIGLLVGGLLMPMAEQATQQRIRMTQQRLEDIQEALLGFAVLNGRLPCPAQDGLGKEVQQTTINVCDAYDKADGYLPWATLGVEQYDAWGRPFRYRVDGWFSDKPMQQKTEASLELRERNGKPLNIPVETNSNYGSNLVAIIFSCGKNGRPDDQNDADGVPNLDTSCTNPGTAGATKNLYIQDAYVADQFDDILVTLPKVLLINRLTVAGKWPP
jgi:prepilin-type N-terminal cleavage/methylation domain-containing protein